MTKATNDQNAYELIEQCHLALSENLSARPRSKADLVTQLFRELLDRMQDRVQMVIGAEESIDADKLELEKVPLHLIQLKLVDRTEAFHQHIYAVLGGFTMFLNHLAPPSFKRHMPVRSISNMMDFLETKIGPRRENEFALIRKSLEFRNRFVDHPQQHAVHNWMTCKYRRSTVIVYFIPGISKTVSSSGVLDPEDPEFTPPIQCESFYVSPSSKKVHESLLTIIGSVCSYLLSKAHA